MKKYALYLFCLFLFPLTVNAVDLMSPAYKPAKSDKPIDPWDFNFCGGERVYPIVGLNISTVCGPRNQVGLGRRGKIMWFFPAYKDQPTEQGSYKLNEEQLNTLTLLAEVTQVAASPEVKPSKVIYKMGINFSARLPKYIFTDLNDEYSPSKKLLDAMLSLVPVKPRLPECNTKLTVFDPTLHQDARHKLLSKN